MKHTTTVLRLFFLALFVFFLSTGHMTLWLGLFALGLLAAPFAGRLYCGYACPMNTLMIPAEWASKKLRLQAQKTPKWLGKGQYAWIALLVSVAAMLLAKRFLRMNLPILPIWLALAVLVTLRYKPAVFHNLLCPFAGPLKICSRSPKWAKRVREDACIGCGLCEKACPSKAITVTGAEKKAHIQAALCHQCPNCGQVCPTGAIHSGRQKDKASFFSWF